MWVWVFYCCIQALKNNYFVTAHGPAHRTQLDGLLFLPLFARDVVFWRLYWATMGPRCLSFDRQLILAVRNSFGAVDQRGHAEPLPVTWALHCTAPEFQDFTKSGINNWIGEMLKEIIGWPRYFPGIWLNPIPLGNT